MSSSAGSWIGTGAKLVRFRRDSLACLATPVSVVTTIDSSGAARGVTVGTLCSLSLTPPLVMFSLDRAARSHKALTTAATMLIHVLRNDQADIAATFAQTGTDRFEELANTWHGLPTIPGTVVRLECSRYGVTPGGDHSLIICLVEDVAIGTGDPLLYHSRRYCTPLQLAFPVDRGLSPAGMTDTRT